MRSSIRFATLAAVAALLSACAPLGPRTIQVSRPLYNEAVQQTEAQQLLLNIVRQRYNDPIMFLDVTSISSGASRSVNAAVTPKVIPQGGRDEYVGSVGATYSETPIIFYAPNNGEKFVRQMLSPLDLRTLTLVLQSGWSIERVLMLTGTEVNGLRNLPPSDTGGTQYRDMSIALRDLQRRGELSVGVTPGATKEAQPNVVLVFTPEARNLPSYQTVCKILSVPCDGGLIPLRQGLGIAGGNNGANIATRSLFSAMYYLSQSVDVPETDIASGTVDSLRNDVVPDRIFNVRSSAAEPTKAAVKVFYRGAWFYVADDDIGSKTTFSLMSMLVTLQAGDTTKITPLVSLPGS